MKTGLPLTRDAWGFGHNQAHPLRFTVVFTACQKEAVWLHKTLTGVILRGSLKPVLCDPDNLAGSGTHAGGSLVVVFSPPVYS